MFQEPSSVMGRASLGEFTSWCGTKDKRAREIRNTEKESERGDGVSILICIVQI